MSKQLGEALGDVQAWLAPPSVPPFPLVHPTSAQRSPVSLNTWAQSNPNPLHGPFCLFSSFFGGAGCKTLWEMRP